MKIQASVNGSEYTATVNGCNVVISKDGVWAGSGRWNGDQIVDCAADLGDEAYEALDDAIRYGMECDGEQAYDQPVTWGRQEG